MTLGQQIRSLRKGRQLTLKALGSEVGVGPVTVHEIETDVRPPAPDLVARLAKVLDAPQLLVAHCETCPVCTELVPVKYPHLDNIPTHPAVVTHRAAQEAREAAAALEVPIGTVMSRLARARRRIHRRLYGAHPSDAGATEP